MERADLALLLREKLVGRTLEPLGEVKDLSPMARGKKGLVFLVEGGESRGVLRFYRDPLVMARTRRVYDLCSKAGVSVARIHFFEMAKGWLKYGLWGLSLEEWVEPWQGDGREVLEELVRLHSIRRKRWGDPLVGRVGDWLEREMARALSRLERWAEWRGVSTGRYWEWLKRQEARLTPLNLYSLTHGDLAPSNLGAREGRPVFIDLDRARFSHPLVDVTALVHHFSQVGDEAVGDYLAMAGLTWEDWTFFLFLFHLKRLVRALKHWRKGEDGWSRAVMSHEARLRELTGS